MVVCEWMVFLGCKIVWEKIVIFFEMIVWCEIVFI